MAFWGRAGKGKHHKQDKSRVNEKAFHVALLGMAFLHVPFGTSAATMFARAFWAGGVADQNDFVGQSAKKTRIGRGGPQAAFIQRTPEYYTDREKKQGKEKSKALRVFAQGDMDSHAHRFSRDGGPQVFFAAGRLNHEKPVETVHRGTHGRELMHNSAEQIHVPFTTEAALIQRQTSPGASHGHSPENAVLLPLRDRYYAVQYLLLQSGLLRVVPRAKVVGRQQGAQRGDIGKADRVEGHARKDIPERFVVKGRR
jgi:hypothetical protein